MKALTLRHPWPFAICFMGKRIENRSWKPPTAMIGQRFAIHGGKQPAGADNIADIRFTFEDLERQHGRCDYRVNDGLTVRDIILPGIVATAVLDRVVSLTAFRTRDADPALRDPWFDADVEGNVGWVLRDLIVLPSPIPCKGAQGLWELPFAIESEVRSASPFGMAVPK